MLDKFREEYYLVPAISIYKNTQLVQKFQLPLAFFAQLAKGVDIMMVGTYAGPLVLSLMLLSDSFALVPFIGNLKYFRMVSSSNGSGEV
jgi:hypothetical protein